MMKLVFLGPPGAGKGTQAVRLAKLLGVPHISTGDIFRKNIADQTQLGLLVKQYMDQGQLVPDEVTISIVADRLNQSDCQNGFLLDGFPRTLPQAQGLSQQVKLDAVVNLEVKRDSLMNRLTGRRVCPSCGGTFHVSTHEGDLCTVCQTPLVHRTDDQPATVSQRLEVYDKQTQPLIAYYQAEGLIRDVDGSQSPEDVAKAIVVVLGVNP